MNNFDKELKEQFLFQKVDCSAFLKKIHDGVYIKYVTEAEANETRKALDIYETLDSADFFTKEGWVCFRNDGTHFLSPCEGAYDVEKTYYKTVERNFSGVCVGFVRIVTEGYLGVDTGYRYNGNEYEYVFKATKTLVTAAIVYYANNRKRLVPVECVKVK